MCLNKAVLSLLNPVSLFFCCCCCLLVCLRPRKTGVKPKRLMNDTDNLAFAT